MFFADQVLFTGNTWFSEIIIKGYKMLTEASWGKDHLPWKTQKVWIPAKIKLEVYHTTFPMQLSRSHIQQFCVYLPFVRFCQNWAFSNQIFWRQTIILLPLSFFHWIGDKPFLAMAPSSPAWGACGSVQATNQPSSRMLHRALCGYRPWQQVQPAKPKNN